MITLAQGETVTRYAGDSLSVSMVVEDCGQSPTTVLDLTGATARAALVVGGAVYAGAAEITNAANGVVTATWAPGAIRNAGFGRLHVRVNRIGQSEIVLAYPVVIRSAAV